MSNYPRTKSLFVVLTAEGVLASCSTDKDGSDTYSTPSSNTDCASACIETFVVENYPASICPDNQDLRCLCTRYNPSGLTIGEALLQCVLANCIGVSTEQLGQLYSICSGISGALPETHSTLTATVEVTSMSTDIPPAPTTDPVPPSTSSLPPSIPSPSSTDVPSSIIVASGTSSITSSSDDTTLVTSTASTSSSRQSSTVAQTTPEPQTSSAPTALAQSTAKDGLSRGTVAGIAVGGVATAFIVFGLLYLFYCIRKRRKSKRYSDKSLSDSGRRRSRRHSIPSSFFGSSPADPPAAAVISPVPYIPPAGGSQRRSFWRRSIKPEEIGVAVSPELTQKESPANSIHSQASASALLPDKPNWTSSQPVQQSQQARSRSPVRVASTGSTGTVFDEDVNRLGVAAPSARIHPTVQNQPPYFNLRPLQPHRPPRLVLTQSGHGLPSDPRAQMYAMERQQRATGYAAQPRIPLTPIYDNGNVTAPLNAWTASAPPARPQLPPGPLRDPRVRLAPPIEKQRSNSSIYDSNASLPPSEPRGHESFSIQPVSSRPSQQFSSQPSVRNSTIPNPAVRASTASSTTTFEDEDDYNLSAPPAPPATLAAGPPASSKPTIRHLSSHQSRPITLSPVIESPHRNGYPQPKLPRYVAYPPIPRPASVARQAERLPLPRAGRYIDTRGPQSLTNPTPPFASDEGLSNSDVTTNSWNGQGGPSSSLEAHPPSSSSIRIVPNEAISVNTNGSLSNSAQDREQHRGRSTSPSEHSSALLARRRQARSAALRIDEEAQQKKRGNAEARPTMGTETEHSPNLFGSRNQVLQQAQDQSNRRAMDYEGSGWGALAEEGKENENEVTKLGKSRNVTESDSRQRNMNMTPTRGRAGNKVLRVGK